MFGFRILLAQNRRVVRHENMIEKVPRPLGSETQLPSTCSDGEVAGVVSGAGAANMQGGIFWSKSHGSNSTIITCVQWTRKSTGLPSSLSEYQGGSLIRRSLLRCSVSLKKSTAPRSDEISCSPLLIVSILGPRPNQVQHFNFRN